MKQAALRKLKYYRRYVQPEMTEVRLTGRSFATDHDGEREFYAALAHGHFAGKRLADALVELNGLTTAGPGG